MQLRDYQIECRDKAVSILKEYKMCLLAMECRLGKTFVSLSTAKEIGAKGVLFVTTKKALPSINSDYETMSKDDTSMFSFMATNYEDVLAKHKAAMKRAEKVISEEYPMVARKGVKFKRLVQAEYNHIMTIIAPYLMPSNFDTVIIDECHKTGAFPKTGGCQKVLKEISKFKKVIFMSGTPNPESFSMFYNEFDISTYSPWCHYKNFYAWAKDYVNIGQKMINGLPIADYSNGIEEKIMRDVSKYMVSYTQCQAGFSTKIDERIMYVPMKDSTKQFVDILKKDKIAEIVTDNGESVQVIADTPANLVSRVHQAAGGTIKVDDDYFIFDDSKVNWIEQNFHGRHFCIFYVYKAERELLIRSFPFVTEDWQEFQRDPRTIFIGQIRSCREGCDMSSAEFSIFYSMEYSYVSYAQGINRIVSKDRDTPSIVLFLTSQCKIEKMIIDCVHDKSDFTSKVFYGRY